MKMKSNFKLYATLILFMGIGFGACDDDSGIDESLVDLKIAYTQIEGEEYNGMVYTVNIPSDGDVKKYSSLAYESEVPKLEGSVTSIVLKEVNTDSEEEPLPLDPYNLDKETGVLQLLENMDVNPGMYLLDIQVNSAKQSENFVAAFKLNVIGTALNYPSITVLEGKAMESELPEITGGIVPTAYELSNAPDEFVINAETGVISATDDNTIAIGEYALTVLVTYADGQIAYKKACVVNVEKEIIAPADLIYADKEIFEGEALNVTPSVTGNSLEFSLAAGTPEAFVIDNATGEISLAAGHALAIDEYIVAVTASNSKGNTEGTFKLLVKKEPLPVPANLVYTPAEVSIKGGDAFDSAVPTIENGDNVEYSIVSDHFTINAQTGVISAAAANTIPDAVYNLNVIVTYAEGVVQFDAVYQITVTSDPLPPANLVYATAEKTMPARGSFSSVAPTIDNGDGVVYSIDDDTNFAIDATGVISIANGITILGGTYDLTVTATNGIGSTTAAYKVIVSELRYATNPLTGTVAVGVSITAPELINLEAGGTMELRGLYFTGTLGGVEYTDVLMEGGKSNFTKPNVQAISDALGWTKNSNTVDMAVVREAFGITTGGDGSITTVPGSAKLAPASYSLNIRYTSPSGTKSTFMHNMDITLN